MSKVQFSFGVYYNSRGTHLLVGFTNFDWDGNPNDWTSTTTYVFALGSESITWACKKQSAIALSLVE